MNIDVNRLIVKYNNKTVGFLEEIANKRIAFQYEEDWVSNGFSISPFSLPLSHEVFISKSLHFSGLYGVFNDSLPDGWGEFLVRRILTKKGINIDKISMLTRLSLLSSNGLGGLTYEPTQADKSIDKLIDLDSLANESRKIYDLNIESDDFDNIFALGGASGGARPKVHVKIKNEDWIIKFPSSIDPENIGVLEYNANQLAVESGIKVNEFKLFQSSECSGYYGTKRFDRFNNQKLHMISLSALLETTHRIPNLDYKHLFQVIQKICVDQGDMLEAYKRMCFNVLYKNKDDHGKNIAFIYDERLKGYRLSPFYDITKTPNKLEHEMTVLGKGIPLEKDLLEMAKQFNLSEKKCSIIIKSIKEIIKIGRASCRERV